MRVLLLGSRMNYNLEYYIYKNLKIMGHKVMFYGYYDKIGNLAKFIRMIITRSKQFRSLSNILWLNKINDEISKLKKIGDISIIMTIQILNQSKWIK